MGCTHHPVFECLTYDKCGHFFENLLSGHYTGSNFQSWSHKGLGVHQRSLYPEWLGKTHKAILQLPHEHCSSLLHFSLEEGLRKNILSITLKLKNMI